jgi:hypothetical protein
MNSNMNIHTKHQIHNIPCKVCARTKAKKQERLALIGGTMPAKNELFERAKPFIQSYYKAIKELQGQPIRRNDGEVLVKYGLKTNGASTFYHKASYDWNYEILALNKEYKALNRLT